MPELDGQLAELYDAYLGELGAAFDALEPWWQRLQTGHGRKRMKLRWPAGLASHPRVLAIYADYHHRIASLRPPMPEGPAPRFDDDEAWGSEAEPEPSLLIPPPPRRVLVDRLQVEAEALYAKMIYLVMPPIAELPEPRPSMRDLEVVEPDTRGVQVFHFELRHGTRPGLERLFGAGIDLRPAGLRGCGLADAGEVHRLAHGAYRRALERALVAGETWWTRELALREVRGLSPAQALDDLYAAQPIGPASHPQVVGVIQAYWALCHEINEVLSDTAQHVAPEQLLLAWLRDGQHDSWIDVLTAMPYWPVGLDAEGRWT